MDGEVAAGTLSRGVPSTPAPAQPSLAVRQREGRKTTPAFLSNLGKATLRGIRKCPQCGVYNGTRGLSCKNKACGVVLRDGSVGGRNPKRSTIEVVKVVIDGGEPGDGTAEEENGGGGGGVSVGASGGGVQVFSVCQRGRGATATQLGFVELVPTDTAIATGDGATLLTRINLGRCFLPCCRQKSNPSQSAADTSKQGSPAESLCIHIKQAMECQSHATPLTLKSSTLEGLQAPVQAREELWRLATESPGPLVQRVSMDTLVVKCHSDSSHPLGLLHLTVGGAAPAETSKAEEMAGEGRPPRQASFHCACQVSARRGKPGVDTPRLPGVKGFPGSRPSEPCLHFYACVCAFASDDQLASDFAAFINYSPSGVLPNSESRNICALEKPLHQQPPPINSHHKPKRLRLDEPPDAHSLVSSAGPGKEGVSPLSPKKVAQRKGSSQFVDEHAVTMGFHQWLASVTEKIHQTMHYQFNGKPEPLVYQIPQEFFNALQHRLSLGSKKRRLPNITTAFVRKDGLPLGSFSKYTWHITNLMQVKRVFDTPQLPLEVTQSFVKNIDGSYSTFHWPEPSPESEQPGVGYKTERPQVIRPMELRTFLKVGSCTEDLKEVTPFVIEWIPDVLPRSRVGELRISFEFGHQQSGQPSEHCDGDGQRSGGTERTSRSKSSVDHNPIHTPRLEILQVVV